jgi:ubiquinone/menaquinone biosynthesis C-methylase UbiE
MNKQYNDLQEKIRQQFDTGPYPRNPIEQSPKKSIDQLYLHNLVTSYYLRYGKYMDTKDKLILDAACGSGYKTLTLAEANPGAKIVAIDISEISLNLAKQRLAHHGFNNVEFYLMSLEEQMLHPVNFFLTE